MELSQPLNLRSQFPDADLAAWERQFLSDLGVNSMVDAGWAPPGEVPAAPLTRRPEGIYCPSTPGWEYVEDVRLDTAGQAIEALQQAAEGGADAGVLKLADSVDAEEVRSLCRDTPIPIVLAGGSRPEGLLDLERVRGHYPDDCYIDLSGWGQAGASLCQLGAIAFSALASALDRHSGRTAHPILIEAPVRHELFHGAAFLRALRIGAARIAREFDAPTQPIIRASTCQTILMERDLHTNLIRTTTAAVASVLGGADWLTVHPHDTTTGGSASGRRLARNVAHLLRHESHLDKVADP
ncbi:MAG: hypothetical protein HKN29_14725, partial [Rhodothermales bacterium]|nr:hypothetical protein [Rhodothermales bacterium]